MFHLMNWQRNCWTYLQRNESKRRRS